MLEATDAPTLRFLLDNGTYRRALSTFPSLTPVCLASVATGGHPDVHGIPHLVWWNRGEQRLVEYGSSFGALVDAGLTTAAINITTYRGRNRHVSSVPGLPPVHGPKHFFFYSVYESDRTGAT